MTREEEERGRMEAQRKADEILNAERRANQEAARREEQRRKDQGNQQK